MQFAAVRPIALVIRLHWIPLLQIAQWLSPGSDVIAFVRGRVPGHHHMLDAVMGNSQGSSLRARRHLFEGL